MNATRRSLLLLAMLLGVAAAFGLFRDKRNHSDRPEAQWARGNELCPQPDWYRGAIRPDTSCVPAILSDTTFGWRRFDSPHFTLYHTASSGAGRNVDHLLERAEVARRHNLELLGSNDYPQRIHLFYPGTRAEYQRIVGGSGMGVTIPQAQLVVLLLPDDGRAPDDRHEIMHALSLNQWGSNAVRDYWLREGLSVLATERCTPGVIDSTARAMLADGRALPLSAYRKEFFLPGRDNYPSYMLNGSFVKFLYHRGGATRLRELWNRGSASFERVYGSDAEVLEAEWKRALATAGGAQDAFARRSTTAPDCAVFRSTP